MKKNEIEKLAILYRDTLFKDVIPFWEKHSVDWEYGGYYSCLDRKGNVYDTDKFMWMQCREVWTFSMLYNEVEKKERWIKIARNGADFLKKHGMDREGSWYFSLDRKGRPLVQPYNIYSDCDACIAYSQYAKATGDEKAKEIAIRTYRNIIRREEDPKGQYSKAYPGTRSLRELGLTVTMVIVTLEMQWLLEEQEFNSILDKCFFKIFEQSLDKEKNLLFEYTAPDGSDPDCFESRLILPGHGIEGMWYVMEAASRRNNQALINRALDVALSEIQFGWDKEYGGIHYFLDVKGHPPVQLEWDRKLWWVHLEALVAFLLGYQLTGRKESWEWFKRVHEYTWSHFPDAEYGEWWGYLDRSGKPFLRLKGGKFKGCFHLPRALFKCCKTLEKLV